MINEIPEYSFLFLLYFFIKTRPVMQYILSRPGRTYGDGGDESTLACGKYIDLILIRGAN